jgi:hypothetical protein
MEWQGQKPSACDLIFPNRIGKQPDCNGRLKFNSLRRRHWCHRAVTLAARLKPEWPLQLEAFSAVIPVEGLV